MTGSAVNRRSPAARSRIIVAPIMKHGVSVLPALLALVVGCPPRQMRVPYDPIPMREAAAIVNGNISKIKGTLRAVGSVDGTYTLEVEKIQGAWKVTALALTLINFTPFFP